MKILHYTAVWKSMPEIMIPMPSGMTTTANMQKHILIVVGIVLILWIVQMFAVVLHR